MNGGLPDERRSLVESELDSIERSVVFSNAPRLMKLLRYLVAAQLSGHGGELNQTRIAIEVMERGADFDPYADSLVRVEAGRLRGKLREYYATEGQDDPVRIELPKGRYSPNLLFNTGKASVAGPVQQIRFLKTADNTTLAYATSGRGYPLVKAANWLSHLEFDRVSPVWRHWWSELSHRYRLIRYDERGCGLSDWEVDEFSVETWVADLESVIEAADVGRFALLGISQGAAVAISYAVRHPERVSHLILYGGFAQGRLKRNASPELEEEAILLKNLMRVGWGQENAAFRRTFASLFVPDATREEMDAFDALQRASTSPANAEKFMDAFNKVDVVDLAAQVSVPTLVMHARHEVEIPMAQARLLASTIPGARLVPLESRNHIIGESEPAWQQFLAELTRFLPPDRGELDPG
jgi:pimeloyl-ACP methyl ester carboxylesterase